MTIPLYTSEYMQLLTEEDEGHVVRPPRIQHVISEWFTNIDKIKSHVMQILKYWASVHNDENRDYRKTAITIPNLRHNILEGQPVLYYEKRALDRTILKVLNSLVVNGMLQRATIVGGKNQSAEVQGWAFTDAFIRDVA